MSHPIRLRLFALLLCAAAIVGNFGIIYRLQQ